MKNNGNEKSADVKKESLMKDKREIENIPL